MGRNDKGGLNRIVIETANLLTKDHEVIMCTWGEPYLNGYQSNDDISELAVAYPEGRIDEYVSLLALIQPDVYIYSHCCYEPGLCYLSHVKQFGIKTIAWCHEDYFLPHWQTMLHDCLSDRQKYLPQADAVIWLNRNSLALYGLRYDNGVCIPNYADYLNLPATVARKNNVLVAVGRYDDARKGLGDLLCLFAYVLKRRPDTELYIVGNVDLTLPAAEPAATTCAEFIQQAGITDRQLHLVSWTENVEQYFEMGVLHLMPSKYEGFGLVVLEAAACGMPTVAYDGSGMQDIISGSHAGALTKCGNWKEMADTVLRLLNQPDTIDEMRRSLPDILKRFSRESFHGKWVQLLHVLLADDPEMKERYFASQQLDFTRQMAERLLREYEAGVPVIGQESCEEVWHAECLKIQNSFSWRITKPLRLCKKVWTSLRCNGLRATFVKVGCKLKSMRRAKKEGGG